ncbi:MAG: CAP domain-containing protein [Ilumatobacteraceae bacterium]
MTRTRHMLIAVAVTAGIQVVQPVDAAVDSTSRAAVISAYEAEFNRLEPESAWAGSQADCSPGTTTAEYQASVLQRVNWYRSQAGLPPVTYDGQYTAAAQAAALYQSRQGSLSHAITAGTPCYSAAASEGSMRSNLHLGVRGVRAIDGYIVDPGANNTPVGHRQWILSRTLGTIATGDVDSAGTYMRANALFVVTPTVPAATPRDGYVAWPNPGYFPDAVVPERWSFTPAGTTDFSAAQVSVTGPSGAVAATIVHAAGHLVFETKVPASVTADSPYRVSITGASGGQSWTYDVTLVDVNSAPRTGGTVSWGTTTCASVGTPVWKQVFVDDDPYAVRAVSGVGDSDNTLFSVDTDGTIRVGTELPRDRTAFSIRVRATDSKGAATETRVPITMKDPSTMTSPCPPRNVKVTLSGGRLSITWDAPAAGSGFTFRVYTKPATSGCSTTSTGCVISTSVTSALVVSVYAVRKDEWSVPADITVSGRTSGGGGADSNGSTTTVPPNNNSVTKVKRLKKSTRYSITRVMRIPPGTRAFRTSGSCRMTGSNTVLSTRSTKGTCTVTVVTALKSGGRTVRTTTRATFTVG